LTAWARSAKGGGKGSRTARKGNDLTGKTKTAKKKKEKGANEEKAAEGRNTTWKGKGKRSPFVCKKKKKAEEKRPVDVVRSISAGRKGRRRRESEQAVPVLGEGMSAKRKRVCVHERRQQDPENSTSGRWGQGKEKKESS